MNVLKQKWVWIVVGSVLLAIVGLAGWQMMNGTAAAEAQSETGEIVTVFVGDLSASATAAGQVEAQRDGSLAFATAGTVDEVFVVEGDTVAAGDVLMVLDTAALERAVQSAEQDVLIQENNLATLLEPATAAEIASAEAAVSQAQAALDSLLDGPTEEEIASAEAAVSQAQSNLNAAATRYSDVAGGASDAEILAAENRLADAQKAYTEAEEAHRATYDCEYIPESDSYDCVGGSEKEQAARIVAASALADLKAAQETYDQLLAGGNTLGIATNAASVSSAQASVDVAQAQLDALFADPTTSELASAESNVASAQANLNNLLDGASAAQIATQEARLEQTRLNLRQAEQNLAEASLIAPFDGVVTAVNLSVGEQTNGVAVELVDTASYEVVLTVDEVDIGSISVGQLAEVTLEAWPDETIAAEVVSIAPQAVNDSNGIVSYEVYLALGETDRPLLVGMTADANLVTAQRDDVLLVPNQAINADRQTGTYTVTLVNGDTTEEVTVTIGLRDEEFTQITSGVREGDQLLIGNILPVAQQAGNGGGPFGGN